MMTFNDFQTLGRTDPELAAKAWRAKTPIRFTKKNYGDALTHLASADLRAGRNAVIVGYGQQISLGRPIEIAPDLLASIDLSTNDDAPSATMGPVALASLALTVFAIAMTLGSQTEEIMDEDDEGGIVVNGNEGNVTIIVGGDGK